MKQAKARWLKFKEKALSRARQRPLSRAKQLSQNQHNTILLLHLVEFLEYEVLTQDSYCSSPKASLLVEEIHDWKERTRNGS